ncbi:MAG: hypothetical protein R3C49_26320 [Planctomycetaceae bacterium]
MGDLKDPRLIWLKGVLFVGCGLLSGLLVFLKSPEIQTAALLFLTVWCFCRSYYFAFYVVQHYVDPDYRFSGLTDFACYCLGIGRYRRTQADE